MRTSVLLLVMAACALAQSESDPIWYIEVTAPQNFVLSGRSLRLEAQAVTVRGVEVPNFTPEWRSSNPLVATVDEAGTVRGLAPGAAVIEAVRDGVAGQFSVRVQPLRIEIQPSEMTVDIGGQASLIARALNADGAPIPGMRFLWYSGLPAVVSVDGAGMVTGRVEGAVTVSASLDVPEAGFGASAQATVRVRRRSAFRTSRLVSSDLETRPVTLKRIEQIAYGGGDRVAAVGALSNGSQALMMIEGGSPRVLAVSGEYFETTGQVLGGFGSIALNAAGDLLAQLQFPYWPHSRLVQYRGGKWETFDLPGNFGGVFFWPRSLGERGEAVFAGWDERGQNLMYRREDGRLDRILTAGDRVDGAVVQGFNDGALIPGGVIAGVNLTTGFGYYQWDGRELRRLVRAGDALLGRAVRWMWPPLANAAGEIYLVFGSDDATQLVRFSGGTWSLVVQTGLPLSNGTTVRWIDALRDVRGAAVLFSGGSDRTGGLFRLQGGALETVAPYGQSEQNGEWRWFEAAFLHSSGGVIAKGIQGNQVSRLARLGAGASTALLDAGRGLDVSAPTGLDWGWLLGGGAGSNLVFRSFSGALMRVGRNSLQPVVSFGDPMPPAGAPLVWIGAQASSSRGDFAFVAGTTQNQGLYLWRNGALTLLAETNGEIKGPGGWNIHGFGSPIAVNNDGQVTVWAWGEGRNAQLLFAEGSRNVQSVVVPGTQAPGGGIFDGGVWNAVIDDRGRVAFAANVAPSRQAGLYLWEAGRIDRIRQFGDIGPNGLPLVNFEGPFRAAGNRLFANFRYGEWGQQQQPTLQIVEFDVTDSRPLVSAAGCLSGQYAVNAAGDLLYSTCLADGGNGLILRRSDGRETLVASTTQPSSDGDWFWQFLGSYVNDQGDAFFSAVTLSGLKDRITLFQAAPE